MSSERIRSLPLSNVSRFSIPRCLTGNSEKAAAKFCVVATLLLHKALKAADRRRRGSQRWSSFWCHPVHSRELG